MGSFHRTASESLRCSVLFCVESDLTVYVINNIFFLIILNLIGFCWPHPVMQSIVTLMRLLQVHSIVWLSVRVIFIRAWRYLVNENVLAKEGNDPEPCARVNLPAEVDSGACLVAV